MNQIKQMENKRIQKVKQAQWLVSNEGYTLTRAAQTMSVTVKEVRDVSKHENRRDSENKF